MWRHFWTQAEVFLTYSHPFLLGSLRHHQWLKDNHTHTIRLKYSMTTLLHLCVISISLCADVFYPQLIPSLVSDGSLGCFLGLTWGEEGLAFDLQLQGVFCLLVRMVVLHPSLQDILGHAIKLWVRSFDCKQKFPWIQDSLRQYHVLFCIDGQHLLFLQYSYSAEIGFVAWMTE